MKEQKLTASVEKNTLKNLSAESRTRLVGRANSLRPMKSLMKIKSLRPNTQTQVGTTKIAEKMF